MVKSYLKFASFVLTVRVHLKLTVTSSLERNLTASQKRVVVTSRLWMIREVTLVERCKRFPTFHSEAADIKSLLGTIGSDVSDEDINRCIDSLKGKPIHQLIANGQKKVGSSAGASGAPAASNAPKKEEKKEKK